MGRNYVLWNAQLPDYEQRFSETCGKCQLWKNRTFRIHRDSGTAHRIFCLLLHPVPFLQGQPMDFHCRFAGADILLLFLCHHRSRTLTKGDRFGIPCPNHRRFLSHLPEKIRMGMSHHTDLFHDRPTRTPADDHVRLHAHRGAVLCRNLHPYQRKKMEGLAGRQPSFRCLRDFRVGNTHGAFYGQQGVYCRDHARRSL